MVPAGFSSSYQSGTVPNCGYYDAKFLCRVRISLISTCQNVGTMSEISLFLAPLMLSGVCAHWRSIVDNTPSLWSNLGTIDIHMELAAVRKAQILGSMQMFLQRSKMCRLSFHFAGSGPDEDGEFPRLLASESDRWFDVHFSSAWLPSPLKKGLASLASFSGDTVNHERFCF